MNITFFGNDAAKTAANQNLENYEAALARAEAGRIEAAGAGAAASAGAGAAAAAAHAAKLRAEQAAAAEIAAAEKAAAEAAARVPEVVYTAKQAAYEDILTDREARYGVEAEGGGKSVLVPMLLAVGAAFLFSKG